MSKLVTRPNVVSKVVEPNARPQGSCVHRYTRYPARSGSPFAFHVNVAPQAVVLQRINPIAMVQTRPVKQLRQFTLFPTLIVLICRCIIRTRFFNKQVFFRYNLSE
jgi:hypothetical protein